MRVLAAALLVSVLAASPASARSLAQVRDSGSLSACLPANVLPFSHRKGSPPGFQVELAQALAKQLGVSLEKVWVISHIQAARGNCDIRLDVIDDQEAQGESHLALSKPYYHGGVELVSRPDHPLNSLSDLNGHTKVAVQVGSIVAMLLGERHVGLSMFGFEDEMLDAVANGEVDATMVTPASAGYFNLTHPGHKLHIALPKDLDAQMAWNVSIGLRRPDKPLREAIDAALDKLSADGTLSSIYGRYGVTLSPPK